MTLVTEAEARLRVLSRTMTDVGPAECLFCYLCRMLDEFGCTGDHRFSERWRDSQPRRMPALLRWLADQGGCCCDCEVVLNVFRPGRRSRRHERLQCLGSYHRVLEEYQRLDEPL